MKTLTTTCIALAIVMGLSLAADAQSYKRGTQQNRGKTVQSQQYRSNHGRNNRSGGNQRQFQRRGSNSTQFVGGIVDHFKGKKKKQKNNQKYLYDVEVTPVLTAELRSAFGQDLKYYVDYKILADGLESEHNQQTVYLKRGETVNLRSKRFYGLGQNTRINVNMSSYVEAIHWAVPSRSQVINFERPGLIMVSCRNNDQTRLFNVRFRFKVINKTRVDD